MLMAAMVVLLMKLLLLVRHSAQQRAQNRTESKKGDSQTLPSQFMDSQHNDEDDVQHCGGSGGVQSAPD